MYLLDEENIKEENFENFLNNVTDIPSRKSNNGIGEVGIVNQNIILKIKGLFDQSTSYLYCDLKLCVDLKEHRGIHMSRIEEALFSLTNKVYKSLEDFSILLSNELRSRQYSSTSLVEISATTFVNRQTKRTIKNTQDKVHLFLRVDNVEGDLKISKGVMAYNITACPCTATYTKFYTIPKLKEKGFSLEEIKYILDNMVTGTHTQRGKVFVSLANMSVNTVSFKELYSVLESSTHLVHELLKRADEHDLVIRALKSPQFTEDVVRDISRELIALKGIPDDTEVTIESTQLDSIHIHDVYSKSAKPFSELKKEFSSI
jgi:GTP cyclohydrolase IV